jgi:hypothetical protein
MDEACPGVAAVAKGLIGGLPAAAKRNDGPARQSESGTRRVQDLELPLDPDRTVVRASDFG